MHKAWKKYQNTVYWVDVNFALKKGSKFYQTRSNGITLHETLPACCIPKVVRMENRRNHIRVSICVTSASSEDFLETWLDERIGFRSCSTTKRKPQGEVRRELAGSSPRIVPVERRNWIDIEPGKHSLFEYEVSKKVIYLLRHSQQVHREEDGAVLFWRMKENLQSQFPQSIHWSDDRWKACLAARGGGKKETSVLY